MPNSAQSTSTATSLAVAPPSPRSPLRLSRRVLFSDLPPKHRHNRRRRAADDPDSDDECRSTFLACCTWSCLTLFALILVVLLAQVLFAVFLHASLPAISLRGVDFSKFQIRNETSSRAIVSASVAILMELVNENERMELSFGSLTAKASAASVSLGKSKIPGFSQRPKNTTELRIGTAVRGVGAVREVAEELAAGIGGGGGGEEVDIEVELRGTVGFHVGKIDINGVPVMISCSALKAELDRGNKSLCTVRIFPI